MLEVWTQLSWVLKSGFEKALIMVPASRILSGVKGPLPSLNGGWQNSGPCYCRTEVFAYSLAVSMMCSEAQKPTAFFKEVKFPLPSAGMESHMM